MSDLVEALENLLAVAWRRHDFQAYDDVIEALGWTDEEELPDDEWIRDQLRERLGVGALVSGRFGPDDATLAEQLYRFARGKTFGPNIRMDAIANALTDRRERTLDAVREELEHYTTLDIGTTRHWSEDAIERAIETIRSAP